MAEFIRQISLEALSLHNAVSNDFILRVKGEIQLHSDQKGLYMGDFIANDFLNNKNYRSYWLQMPTYLSHDIEIERKRKVNENFSTHIDFLLTRTLVNGNFFITFLE